MADEKKTVVPPVATVPPKAVVPEKEVPVSGVFAKANFPSYFNLADLQFIYGALRDGDYWTAFARSLKLLNELINPPTTVGGTAGARRQALQWRILSEEEATGFEKVVNQLRDCCDRAQLKGGAETIMPPNRTGKTANPVGEKAEISFFTVISIIQTIVELIERFKKQ